MSCLSSGWRHFLSFLSNWWCVLLFSRWRTSAPSSLLSSMIRSASRLRIAHPLSRCVSMFLWPCNPLLVFCSDQPVAQPRQELPKPDHHCRRELWRPEGLLCRADHHWNQRSPRPHHEWGLIHVWVEFYCHVDHARNPTYIHEILSSSGRKCWVNELLFQKDWT